MDYYYYYYHHHYHEQHQQHHYRDIDNAEYYSALSMSDKCFNEYHNQEKIGIAK